MTQPVAPTEKEITGVRVLFRQDGQEVQEEAPRAAEYVPPAQYLHGAPPLEYCPAGHFVQ